MKLLSSILTLCLLFSACGEASSSEERSTPIEDRVQLQTILTGADQMDRYLPMLEGKSIGMLVNHSSRLNNTLLVDSLLSLGIYVKRIFVPEHGFRGTASAGEKISSGKDNTTGLPIISLYGNNLKPTATDLADLDLLIFDLQDVGARFYTYISSLHYLMEACAEQEIGLIVLDRPNPNGFYVDGPVLDTAFRSFSGMHPVPVVHGMTIGEYALMINGESWLKNDLKCTLGVITCKGYVHNTRYSLTIPPSPNLRSEKAVLFYPSLCLFEGTVVSVGRGTDKPFEQVGHPNLYFSGSEFTPRSVEGALSPKHEGISCGSLTLALFEKELSDTPRLSLQPLMMMYRSLVNEAPKPLEKPFFNNYFDLLAGTDQLRLQILEGKSEAEIRETWQEDLEAFKVVRKKYLLYTDFD